MLGVWCCECCDVLGVFGLMFWTLFFVLFGCCETKKYYWKKNKIIKLKKMK